VLLLSPSKRQSGELAAKVFHQYDAAGQPVPSRKRTELQLWLTNGSRIIALPGKEVTIRGFSGAALLVIDEAARVADALYYAVRPMLAISRGRLIALSTPFGQRGFFYEEWAWVKPDGTPRPPEGDPWSRTEIKAGDCPRITPEFLEEERAALGPRWFAQEYETSFEAAVASLFAYEDLMAACASNLTPLSLPE
jgi:hypothetical protein